MAVLSQRLLGGTLLTNHVFCVLCQLYWWRVLHQNRLKYLQNIIDKDGFIFSTITFDNGSEFKLLNKVKGPKVYFAHPYSPWERGSNENLNGLIREYISKGKSLREFSETAINKIQSALNQKHRKVLNYASAAELIHTSKVS